MNILHSVVWVMALFHLLLVSGANAQGKWFYTTNDGKITITGYSSYTDITKYKRQAESLTIPETLNGMPVVSIGDHAFYNHGLVNVIIPNTITNIGNSAFQSCFSLTNIDIPNGVTTIGFAAFDGCSFSKVFIPQSVTNIRDVAFSHCKRLESIIVDERNPVFASIDGCLINKLQNSLLQVPDARTGSFTIPTNISTVGDTSFGARWGLNAIVVPDSVTNIQWHAFMSCYGLTNVTIGRNVVTIADDDSGWLPFNSPDLATITVSPQNPIFTSVDGVLINKSKNALIKYPEARGGQYTIPTAVFTIKNHAFSQSRRLTSVTIPDSVISIEDNAFEGCVALTNVTFGNQLRSIGISAFSSCTNLTTLIFPNSLTNIGDGAFYACRSLTNVIIGKSTTRIAKTAFSSCSPSLAINVDAPNPKYGSTNGMLIDKHPTLLPLSIKEPANGASINAMWVDVRGTYAAKNLKEITVQNLSSGFRIPATFKNNAFEARNVFLAPGTNTILAIAEDFADNSDTNRITVLGPTETNVAHTIPVQLKLAPAGGFPPLTVNFAVQASAPGKFQRIYYDFDGDGTPDQSNSDLRPVTHTYKTSGQFFPAVTIETSVGHFSNLSGIMAIWGALLGGRDPLFVNVEKPPVLLSTIHITDPVDVKWTAASNLYVLSGSIATLSEFDARGKLIRSKKDIGSNPSGFDLDDAGNVFVVVAGKNQVWKFKPAGDSFVPDTGFGNTGFIGDPQGRAGTNFNQFNTPFDISLSRNGQIITVSDSGNHRLLQFTSTGTFTNSSQISGALQDLNSPKGLAGDEIGIYLFVVDSGNNNIVLSEAELNMMHIGTSGTNGVGLGQFNAPAHVSANNRALYVADTGNNRVQVFSHVHGGEMHSPTPFDPRVAISTELGLNRPKSVAAVNDFLEEMFYIADTGNNRVILVKLPADTPEAVWKHLLSRLKANDINGALDDFSLNSKNKYHDMLENYTRSELRSALKDMEKIRPVTVEEDRAQYYFESVTDGKTITFPIEFIKELGQWKIVEF